MDMDRKEYLSLLESAVSVHPDAPCDKIVNWKGTGHLQTTEDIDDLVERITSGKEPVAADMVQEETAGKEDGKNQAPLSILENELEDADAIDESTNVTDQESEILDRLIKEMDAMDGIDSNMTDDMYDDEDENLGLDLDDNESEEDLELGVPQEEYELDDLNI